MLSEDKIEGIKDCIKFIEKRCKEQKKEIEIATKNRQDFGMFDDCGESYTIAEYEEKAKLQAMVSIKISLEKYAKKLKYELKEGNIIE